MAVLWRSNYYHICTSQGHCEVPFDVVHIEPDTDSGKKQERRVEGQAKQKRHQGQREFTGWELLQGLEFSR
jgi:hypothetical protein